MPDGTIRAYASDRRFRTARSRAAQYTSMPKSRGPLSRVFRFLVWLVAGWLLLTCLLVLAMRWVNPPTSAFMLRERAIADYAVQHRWVDWNEISAHAKVAVIAAEDQLFASHHGFDLKSINDALNDMGRGRRVRGASTISQQVAKNLFLWPRQSWLRKGLEAYFTVLIETLWPKQRILEVYLNVAEFGQGVFGVGAASDKFFRKAPARLNANDAALLAAVLPSPKRMRVNAPSRYVRSRQEWILRHMRALGGTSMLRQL
jgi:monofunctional biosynthetic peptidoglycan transglycosylase